MRGGEIVAEGTPEKVAAEPRSFTGQYLKPLLERTIATPVENAPSKRGKASSMRQRESA